MEEAKVTLAPETFTKYGRTHTLKRRGEHAFIYEITEDDKIISYEVFKRKISKAGMVKFGGSPAQFVEAKERIPSNESFGSWAWCIIYSQKALDKANGYFEALEKFKGDLRLFFEWRSPNPLLDVYELHLDGKPLTTKAAGKIINRTVRVGSGEPESKAMSAFKNMLGSGFDARSYKVVYVGEEYKYERSQELEIIEDENENDED